MDLLSYWKAVTSKNSAEKYIRGITGQKKLTHKYSPSMCSHISWEETENLLLGLRLFIQSFKHVLVGKSSLSARLKIKKVNSWQKILWKTTDM